MSGLPGTFANQRRDWKPGSHGLVRNRTRSAINAQTSQVEIDAPVTTAMDHKYCGGTLAGVSENTALDDIGIGSLALEGTYDATRPKVEDHTWIAILLDHVEDARVRDVTARQFVSSAVRVNLRDRRVTVSDYRSEAPISEGGYRRRSFLLYGQQVLLVSCHSEASMNDFASGMLAGGPNVFLDCETKVSLEASGSFEGWASGVLYGNVHVPNAGSQLLYGFSRAPGGLFPREAPA